MKYRDVSIPTEKKRYTQGRYVLRTDVAFADNLRRFITAREYKELDPAFERNIVYRRHRKFEFPLPFGHGGDAIMKISWPSTKYKWHRRLQLVIKQRYVEDYCETAFYGALALEDIGIPTHKVLAFWTDEISFLRTDSYLIYEKVEADGTGHDLMLKCLESDADDADRQRFTEFLEVMAKCVARLHDAGMRHGDIADHNFLVKFNLSDPSVDSPHTLYMIDTDCVGEAKGWLPGMKQRHDIRDWRIIDLDRVRLKQLLQDYMGDRFEEKWWKLLCFYRSPWYRPFRTIRYLIKGKPLKDPYHLND